MGFVRVTNNTGDDIEGMYDGVPYLFKSGQHLDVPEIVAAHCFGYGSGPNKDNVLARLGWLSTSDKKKEALARLNKIAIQEVQMVGQVVDDPEELAAETADMVPESIGATSPLASPDGATDGGLINPPSASPIREQEDEDVI